MLINTTRGSVVDEEALLEALAEKDLFAGLDVFESEPAYKEGELSTVPIIIKSDVHGSAEALRDALSKLSNDEVKVKVLNVDRERRRIGLSLKRLESDPWSTVSDRYHIDQLVEGTVTKLVKFGAFARIFDDDIEGLIHLSELSDERIAHPREVLDNAAFARRAGRA